MSFRILQFLNRSTKQLQAKFSAKLSTTISISNIRVSSTLSNISALTVNSIEIANDVITVNTSPQFPFVIYYLEFVSDSAQAFESINGDTLQEDGKSNTVYFVGIEDANSIRDSLIENLSPIYDTESATQVRAQMSNLANSLQPANSAILEAGSANYISIDVVDELLTRGYGPTDRLAIEGAYKIVRVAKNATGATTKGTIDFNTLRATRILGNNSAFVNTQITKFPADPVALRTVSVVGEVVSNAASAPNKFEQTTITLSKSNISQIHSIVLTKADSSQFIYDIGKYGYAIYDNKYDTLNGRRLLTLDTNQIKLSDTAILDDTFSIPVGLDKLSISYSYIDNGIDVSETSIEITQVKHIVRETIGAFLTTFFIINFPIVDVSGADLSIGGVVFADPSPTTGTPFVTLHRAFTTEIVFSETRLPALPGEYTINYNTGQAFCYGETIADGTGSHPPVATYYFKKSFVQNIDFTFDADTDEISANSSRSLIGEAVKVSFDYEKVLAPGIDYLPNVHTEIIGERAENRFNSPSQIRTLHSPITNVFKVLNETTGETYAVSHFDNTSINIVGRNAPRISEEKSEPAIFERVFNETLFVSEVISDNDSEKVVKIDLQNDQIASLFGSSIGTNINSSLILSDEDIFVRQFFFDNEIESLTFNLNKLSAIGDYLVDYTNGVVYAKLASTTLDYGSATYLYAHIRTNRPNILSANRITYSVSNNTEPVRTIEAPSFTSEVITTEGIQSSGERFLNNDLNKPIVLGAIQNGVAGQKTVGSHIFVALDALFVAENATASHILRFPNDTDRTILAVLSSTTVQVDIPFTSNDKSASWMLIDFDLADGYRVATTYNIQHINGIYAVPELQTTYNTDLVNLFDPKLDTFENNVITLNSTAIKSVSAGTALMVDYSYGNLYVDYTYVADNIQISYEYGDNSIDFSIGNALAFDDRYFVSYSYGALRDSLILNFGSLTQIDEFSSFPLEFNRELYRDAVGGALASFTTGPTVDAVKGIVSAITKVEPEITELSFDEWTADRDHLHLQEGEIVGTVSYKDSKFDKGIYIGDDAAINFPSEAYISLKEGTFHTWLTPDWRGLDNDASLTFAIGQDGYLPTGATDGYSDGYRIDFKDIYIGASAYNPIEMPFTINRSDTAPDIALGRPSNFGTKPGYFIWFDADLNKWYIRWSAENTINFTGTISTTGEIYRVVDGYGNSNVRSTNDYINIDSTVSGTLGSPALGGLDLMSDNLHYVFDTGPSLNHNRISLYKDGTGYLNLRAIDGRGQDKPGTTRLYEVSTYIGDWLSNEQHHLGASWRLNSAEGIDELHLFVDGQEVSNQFKFGGKPSATDGVDIYGTVASEVLTASATKNTLSGTDGISNTGSTTFTSASAGFVDNSIVAGDTIVILDATADGLAGPHTIASITNNSVVELTAPLTLTLQNIKFSLNQQTFTTSTNVNNEKIAVYTEDDGYTIRELFGLDAESPDYTVSLSGGSQILKINNGIEVGDKVSVQTLGLTKGRVREILFKYDENNQLKTNFIPPVDLAQVDIYKYIFKRMKIATDSAAVTGSGTFTNVGTAFSGTFTGVGAPTNTAVGKRLKVTLNGTDNINFGGTNTVTINGDIGGSASSETVSFSDYGAIITTALFETITSIVANFTAVDDTLSLGALEIIENISLTRSEDGGDKAQVTSYTNGTFTLQIFGSGGLPYDLLSGHYLIDYLSALNIRISQKGELLLGSDIEKNNNLVGILDEVVILNEMLLDVRAGEIPPVGYRSITSDFNSVIPLTTTPQTLMLLHLNENISNVDTVYDVYSEEYFTSSHSVNDAFGDCAVIATDTPYIIDNGESIFNNNTGTLEFWMSPLVDTINDIDSQRTYIDIAAIDEEIVTSTTAQTVFLTRRAKRIESVRLITDTGTGVDYFDGGRLSVDGKAITLGKRLPAQFTSVKIRFVSINSMGDRLSIYKDGYAELNFEIQANEVVYQISYPILWQRNTWHRIMATWDLNNLDNKDRMRLFVDGVEGGTILYGSPGLVYGIGLIYGSAAAGGLSSTFLTTNIDLQDTFPSIFVGNSSDGNSPGMCKIDNIRFSNKVRNPAIVAGISVDLNYMSNLEAALPVLEDDNTTGIFDFDKKFIETNFLSNLFSESTPLFLFDVNVIDSFDKLKDNELAQQLIKNLIDRLRPTHTKAYVKFSN